MVQLWYKNILNGGTIYLLQAIEQVFTGMNSRFYTVRYMLQIVR